MRDLTKATPPLELVVKGKSPEMVAAYACGACHMTAASFEAAKYCCAPWVCDTCGKPIKQTSFCDDCSKKKQQVQSQATYDKAKKVTYAEYTGQMLFCDHCDAYFWDLDSYLDGHQDDDPNDWCWGTDEQPLRLDAEQIIAQELESQEFYEDAFENIDGDAVKEMQAYFDEWLKKQKLNAYMVDYGTVVDLEKEVEEELKQRKAE